MLGGAMTRMSFSYQSHAAAILVADNWCTLNFIARAMVTGSKYKEPDLSVCVSDQRELVHKKN